MSERREPTLPNSRLDPTVGRMASMERPPAGQAERSPDGAGGLAQDCMTILEDASTRPRAFRWVGPPDPTALDAWLAEYALPVPHDLVAFWRVTGGGTVFESEELLPPLGTPDASEALGARNVWHRSRGMAPGFILFHEGSWLSAVRAAEPQYVTLAPGYLVEETFPSLEEWYRCTLRSEFADRYGLSAR